MNAHRYQLRISGLAEDEGRIKAATLQRVLDALLATAERTTRLLATGSGSAKGARPGWLGAAIDVTVTGLSRDPRSSRWRLPDSERHASKHSPNRTLG